MDLYETGIFSGVFFKMRPVLRLCGHFRAFCVHFPESCIHFPAFCMHNTVAKCDGIVRE